MLEEKWADVLSIIGVHSPKYQAEADPDNLGNAVRRLRIKHPVVNDPDHQVWDLYAIRAWPTLVFIAPTSKVIGSHSGEVPFDALDNVLDRIAQEYGLSRGARPAPSSEATDHQDGKVSTLLYPGKVLATEVGLFIADSGHDRVLLADFDGQVEKVIGSGVAGLKDGPVEFAEFRQPQGMAYDGERHILYVADSDNHAVRAVALDHDSVATIAGTGEQARRIVRSGAALEVPLSSPWDLALMSGQLFIAMAGLHQLWLLDLDLERLTVWAGTGHEALRDGQRETAWLAQPMGLQLYARRLYVACAESQAIRNVNLDSGLVTTLIGDGLFEFGDVDGPATGARLQHAQDVACGASGIFIADTYNNKIKQFNIEDASVLTLVGSGLKGHLDGPGRNARLDHPTGISLHGLALFIADTNNHLIRYIDLDSGNIRTLPLHTLVPP